MEYLQCFVLLIEHRQNRCCVMTLITARELRHEVGPAGAWATSGRRT